MCGLTGYVGKEQAAPIVLQSLARLEYVDTIRWHATIGMTNSLL